MNESRQYFKITTILSHAFVCLKLFLFGFLSSNFQIQHFSNTKNVFEF